MQTLFFTVKEWSRFNWDMQEVLCKKYDVILTDYHTTKEKIILLLNKINVKNFNKGMDTFNKSLNKFGKTIDSLTSNKSGFTGFDQGKSTEGLGKISKNEIWGESNASSASLLGKPIKLTSRSVSIWPEKPTRTESNKPRNDMESIWGKKEVNSDDE